MSKAILAIFALFAVYTAAQAPTCAMFCASLFTPNFLRNCGMLPDFATESNCNSWCNVAKPTAGVSGEMSGDTLGCRIYHAGVAAAQPAFSVHCDHASIMGGGVCGDNRCLSYCYNSMNGPCAGTYPSNDVCMKVCATFPTTWPVGNKGSDISANNQSYWTNNVQCRHYHAAWPSVAARDTHCSHGWVTGGNACQDGDDICTGYCQLYSAICTSTAQREPGMTGTASCVTMCNAARAARTTFKVGAAWLGNGSGVTSNDNIDCRVYHLIAAAQANPDVHCPHAWIEATTGYCAKPDSSRAPPVPVATSGAGTFVPLFVLALVAILAMLLN